MWPVHGHTYVVFVRFITPAEFVIDSDLRDTLRYE
jgi:6-pyruvoyl-tetrahydropterin synthase